MLYEVITTIGTCRRISLSENGSLSGTYVFSKFWMNPSSDSVSVLTNGLRKRRVSRGMTEINSRKFV